MDTQRHIAMTSPHRYVRAEVTMTLFMTWFTFQTLQHAMGTEATRFFGSDVTRHKGWEFKKEFQIAGRNITCGKKQDLSETAGYAAEMWSCHDLRVEGRRLQYWHMGGLCSDGRNSSHMLANDYGALCRDIMEVHNVKKTLWAAMITEASCKQSLNERVIYVKDKNSTFIWMDYQPGRGYVITLQCMANPPRSNRPWR